MKKQFNTLFNECLNSTFPKKSIPHMLNCENDSFSLDKERENFIFVLYGSFNPIHDGHIEMIDKSAEYLRIKYANTINYISCIILIRSDESVKFKFKDKTNEIIPFKLRLKMCEKVSDFSSIYVWRKSKKDFEILEYFINKKANSYNCRLRFINLFGSDHYINYQPCDSLCVPRRGYSGKIPLWNSLRDNPNIGWFIAKGMGTSLEISSTNIRNIIASGGSLKLLKFIMDKRILSDQFIMDELLKILNDEKINKSELKKFTEIWDKKTIDINEKIYNWISQI